MNTAVQIPMQEVESSRIHSIGHDAQTNTLAIRFRGKKGPTSLYHYAEFTAANFEAMKNAESIGSHFYRYIKPFAERFPYTCIEKTPVPAQADAE